MKRKKDDNLIDNFEEGENNMLAKYPSVENMKKIDKTCPVYVNTVGNRGMLGPFSSILFKMGFGKKQVIYENDSTDNAKVGDYVAHPWPQGDTLWLLIDKVQTVIPFGNNARGFTYENIAKTLVL